MTVCTEPCGWITIGVLSKFSSIYSDTDSKTLHQNFQIMDLSPIKLSTKLWSPVILKLIYVRKS